MYVFLWLFSVVISCAAVKVVNYASVNDEVGGLRSVQVLYLEVTSLLAATMGFMSATSCVITRDVCDCLISRQEMLVPVVMMNFYCSEKHDKTIQMV